MAIFFPPLPGQGLSPIRFQYQTSTLPGEEIRLWKERRPVDDPFTVKVLWVLAAVFEGCWSLISSHLTTVFRLLT